MDNRSKEMARLACAALEDKKAEDLKVINIGDVSVLSDYFFIACGTNRYQVEALTDIVEDELGKAVYTPYQIEFYSTANWILMDYGDIIIHVFDTENRLFYDLERIWRDGKSVSVEEL